MVKKIGASLLPCSKRLLRTMGIPCAHVIQDRCGELVLSDIHEQWYLSETPNEGIVSQLDNEVLIDPVQQAVKAVL